MGDGSIGGTAALGVALLALLAGCAGTGIGGGGATTAEATDTAGVALPVAGTAFPAGYHIDSAHSLILGEGERWTGRLVYTAAEPADDVFAVLRRDMPKYGWVEIYAVRADVDLLGFQSQATGRVANIRIERSSMLDSTRIDMIVSPAGDGKPPPGQARPLRIPQ